MLAIVFSALAVLAPATQGPPVITPDQAAKYVGKEVIVQGKITQIALTVNLTTHINFGGLYPTTSSPRRSSRPSRRSSPA